MKTPALNVACLLAAASSVQSQDLYVSNASVPLNISSPSARASIQVVTCLDPNNGFGSWWYQTWANGPYYCSTVDSNKKWAMLRAYRAGGQENVHWKYTNDENDGACLTNWKYYTSDGHTWQGQIARTTTMGDTRRWCALPVYRQGGVLGKQWDYCDCRPDYKPPKD